LLLADHILRHCDPVMHPAILRYLAYCGGIGAEVLQTGTIAAGDVIRRIENV
jgi:hypothetical protein